MQLSKLHNSKRAWSLSSSSRDELGFGDDIQYEIVVKQHTDSEENRIHIICLYYNIKVTLFSSSF